MLQSRRLMTGIPSSRRRCVVTRSVDRKDRKREQIRSLIRDIQERTFECHQKDTIECRLAWETMDELEEALRRLEPNSVYYVDPLEEYCKRDPDGDECKVFDI